MAKPDQQSLDEQAEFFRIVDSGVGDLIEIVDSFITLVQLDDELRRAMAAALAERVAAAARRYKAMGSQLARYERVLTAP